MLAEVGRLVLGDHIVQGGGEIRQEPIVLVYYTVRKGAVGPCLEVFEVDIKCGQRICTHATDLRNIVFVCCDSARGRRAGGGWVFYEPGEPNSLSVGAEKRHGNTIVPLNEIFKVLLNQNTKFVLDFGNILSVGRASAWDLVVLETLIVLAVTWCSNTL